MKLRVNVDHVEPCRWCKKLPAVLPHEVYCDTVIRRGDEEDVCDIRTFEDVDAWNRAQQRSMYEDDLKRVLSNEERMLKRLSEE